MVSFVLDDAFEGDTSKQLFVDIATQYFANQLLPRLILIIYDMHYQPQ